MKNPESASKVLKSVDFDHKGEIALGATRAALKLSIDAFINGDLDEGLTAESIVEELKSTILVICRKLRWGDGGKRVLGGHCPKERGHLGHRIQGWAQDKPICGEISRSVSIRTV